MLDANTRKSDRGTFFNTIAYEENGKTIKTVQYPEKFRLQKENFYLLINVSVVEDTVRLNDTSRVFQCAKFEVDKHKVDIILNPPVHMVDDTYLIPPKTIISVKGILRKSSDLIESSNSRRKELTLESLDGQDIIICKLWGETADLVVPPIDSIITATCVQVAVWKGTMSLNSTNLTKLKETEEETLFQGEIEGLEILEESNYIIVDGKTLKVDNSLLETIFPGKIFKETISIAGKAKGLTIAEVKVINPKKKKKTE